jgi:hypothetical protein
MVNLRKGRVFCSRNCTNLDFIFIAVWNIHWLY